MRSSNVTAAKPHTPNPARAMPYRIKQAPAFTPLVLCFVALFLNACAYLDEAQIKPEARTATAPSQKERYSSVPSDTCPANAFAFYLNNQRFWITNTSPDIEQYGIASWYGKPFHGRLTANGERYNMYAQTAAHKSLPMDSLVEVTNLSNDLRTIVRINDHGPFIEGRTIDLSLSAAHEIDMVTAGIAPIRLLVISSGNR